MHRIFDYELMHFAEAEAVELQLRDSVLTAELLLPLHNSNENETF